MDVAVDDLLQEKEYLIRHVLSSRFLPNHICAKYRIEFEDLMQVGRIALWEASEKFRLKEGGTSFDSYAWNTINFRLLDYLRFLRRPIRQLDYSSSIHAEIAEGLELLDAIPGMENTEDDAVQTMLFEALVSDFTKQEKKFFQQRIDGHTYIEIRKDLGVKGKKFNSIRGSAVAKLKRKSRSYAAIKA